MRRYTQHGLGALLAFASLSAQPAHAEPPLPASSPAPAGPTATPPRNARLEVERSAGSESCPDAAAVFRAIERLFPERPFRQTTESGASAASARVVIRSLPSGHEAVLTMLLPYRGERVIREKEDDCRGLADALALAFVMLVEPPDSKAPPTSASATPSTSATTAPFPSTTAVPKAPTAPPPAPSSDASPPRRARSFSGSVTASAVGGFGLLSEPAAGAAAGVELFHELGWGLSLQGLRLWSAAAEAESGSVTLSLWAALFGPCYRRHLSRAVSLDGCLSLGVGSQYASVKGFLSPKSAPFPWTVIVPTLGARLDSTGVLGGFLRVGPVAQLRPQSFSAGLADGTGRTVQVAAAPNIGVMAELGLAAGGALF